MSSPISSALSAETLEFKAFIDHYQKTPENQRKRVFGELVRPDGTLTPKARRFQRLDPDLFTVFIPREPAPCAHRSEKDLSFKRKFEGHSPSPALPQKQIAREAPHDCVSERCLKATREVLKKEQQALQAIVRCQEQARMFQKLSSFDSSADSSKLHQTCQNFYTQTISLLDTLERVFRTNTSIDFSDVCDFHRQSLLARSLTCDTSVRESLERSRRVAQAALQQSTLP